MLLRNSCSLPELIFGYCFDFLFSPKKPCPRRQRHMPTAVINQKSGPTFPPEHVHDWRVSRGIEPSTE